MRASPGLFVVALFGMLFNLVCPDNLEACWRMRRQQCRTNCGIPCWVTIYCPPSKAGEPAKFNGNTPAPSFCWCCKSGNQWMSCDTAGNSCPPGSPNLAYTFTNNFPNDDATCEYSSVIMDTRSLISDPCVYAMICDCSGKYRFATPCEVLNDYNHPEGPHHVVFLPLGHLGMRCKCSH